MRVISITRKSIILGLQKILNDNTQEQILPVSVDCMLLYVLIVNNLCPLSVTQ